MNRSDANFQNTEKYNKMCPNLNSSISNRRFINNKSSDVWHESFTTRTDIEHGVPNHLSIVQNNPLFRPIRNFEDSFKIPESNNLITNLISTDYDSKQNILGKDLCEHWKDSEASCSLYLTDQQHSLNIGPNMPTANYEDDFQIASDTTEISREEIVRRRRVKVAESKKNKKQIRIAQQQEPQQEAHPDFLLDDALGDFPDLKTAQKNKKKYKNNRCDSKSEVVERSKRNKQTEKSWKPKIKDPILININQALQTKSEKVKLVINKIDTSAQRNILRGNILDSDNPQMKKGKVRPDKQRKPTKLKKQILQERNERQIQSKQKENNHLTTELSNGKCRFVDESDTFGEEQLDKRPDNLCPNTIEEVSCLMKNCAIIDNNETSIPKYCDESSIAQKSDEKCDSVKTIHSRKFREYCTNCLTEEVISCVCALLEKLAFFQDRSFARDPIRAQAKRRYVAGISQTKKYLIVNKIKLLVIAPDLEKNSTEGGLDDIIRNFKSEADKQGVPYIFGPLRKRLGKAVFKKALVSCVAVLSYEGAEEQFSKVMEALNDARTKYQDLVNDSSENHNEEDRRKTTPPIVEDYTPAEEVTSSFLAKLRGNPSPADRLLGAICKTD